MFRWQAVTSGLTLALALALSSGTSGCTGEVQEGNRPDQPPAAGPPPGGGQSLPPVGAHPLEPDRSNPACKEIQPGPAPLRRLTRVEYDNTIRDLLGVNFKPADDFPSDDVGYGFDNIGDVLTLSPMLMEKYMRAARTVSRAAVYGESYEEGALLTRLKAKKDQDDSPAVGDILPFSIRGALDGSYHFPVDGEYEFRWRYANFRSPNATR